jgi:hypothetical protein
MRSSKWVALCAVAGLSLTGCQKVTVADNAANAGNEAEANVDETEATGNLAHPSDPIESAMAAGPAAIAADAKIIEVAADGAMKVLREGSNGWTCMPNNPQTPGADPMCMDANALKWAEAWMAHKDPPANNVGFMYMLAGGSDANNMDPWGKEPPAGHQWVETGPHVMVVGAPSLNALYPSGPQPDTTRPYVMFPNTPYAHVMIPVK